MSIEQETLAEYHRRLSEEKLHTYEPHVGQLVCHKSDKPFKLVSSGNQWGKSLFARVSAAMKVGKCDPFLPNISGEPVFVRYCGVNFDTMKQNIAQGFRELLPRHSCMLDTGLWEKNPMYWPGLRGHSFDDALTWNNEEHRLDLADGSFIEFKAYTQSAMSYEGPKRHKIIFDEPPPRNIFEASFARQSTVENFDILIAATPIDPETENPDPWLLQHFIDKASHDDRYFVYEGDVRENKLITEEKFKQLYELYPDPVIRDARLFGKAVAMAGFVYKEYGDHVLIDPFTINNDPFVWEKVIVIDPHPNKPTAVNWFAINRKTHNWYIFNEADLVGSIPDIASQIKNLSSGHMIDTILIDPSSKQGAGIHDIENIYEEFTKYLSNRIMPANNDRALGWEQTRQAVVNNVGQGSRLKVFKTCPKTHAQMKYYSWKQHTAKGEDRAKLDVVKRNDDHCDCVRYFVVFAGSMTSGEKFTGWEIPSYA